MNNTRLYTVGGTIPIEDKIYIQRQADEELLALCRAGTFAYMLAARQMGKSSLMTQTALALSGEGTHCALLDLTELGSQFDDAKWYLNLLFMIEDELELETEAGSWWEDHTHLSETQRLVQARSDSLPPYGLQIVVNPANDPYISKE